MEFWKEAAIYLGLAARSGLVTFLLLFFIVGSYIYIKALQVLPPDFPYWRLTTPLMGLVLAWSPLRTFLKGADRIFLLPAENRMRPYLLRSFVYSFSFQLIWVLGMLLLIWPLYKKVEGIPPVSFLQASLIFVLVKLLSLVSRYQESRLLYPYQRWVVAFMRWSGAVVLAFITLVKGPGVAAAAAAALSLFIGTALTLLPKFRLPWDYWIRKEQEALRSHYTFFSWFADVPKLPAKTRPRRYLAGITGMLPFDRNHTYRYLYAKTFIRSELFGILCRLTLLALFIFLISGGSDLAMLVAYGIVVLLSAGSVSGLDQAHRYSFWLELYPVSKSLKTAAIMKTALFALLTVNTLTGAALLLLSGNKLWAAAAVAIGYGFVAYYCYIPLRSRVRKSEEALP